MAYLSDTRPTKKVVLPSDASYWAIVRVGFKYGELKRFIEYGGSDTNFTTIEKLKLCVQEWNLDDAEGNILPIDDNSIDALQEDDVLAIALAAMPSKNKNEKKNSPEPSSATSAAAS